MENKERLLLSDISVRFGKRVVFNKINFEFFRGNTYILGGANGIGKTSLLNVIAGYIQYEGQVTKAANWTYDYLFQENTLFSNITVEENLLLKYLVRNDNLDGFSSICKNALEQFEIIGLMHKKVELLSGGEKQRVRLAQMLLNKSDIILLDEPLLQINEESVNNICDTISKVFCNSFLFIVSHNNWSGDHIKLQLINGKLC